MLALDDLSPPVALVVFESRNRLSDSALQFALSISPEVIAIHLLELAGPDAEEQQRTLRQRWRDEVERPAQQVGVTAPRLLLLEAQYRTIHQPILKIIDEIRERSPNRRLAVLIPELVKRRWYQHLLHTHRARRLRSQLLSLGRPDLTVVNVPWSPNRV
jgi:hypothetical protein